jgi:hypothetical protein
VNVRSMERSTFSMKEVQWFLPLPEKQEAVKVLSLIFLPSAADSSI